MQKFAHRFAATALALTLSTTCALPAFAETREERLSLAQEYTAMAVADMDIEGIIAQMYIPILPQIEASTGTAITDEQRAKVHTLYMDEMYEPMREIMLAQADVMVDIYTYDEIEALYNFYKSDLGRSAMLKMPELLGAQQPMIMELVQTRMPGIIGQLQAIIEE
ncbi:DUF2059 domain-containing protein [Celeribacter sp.]|uniref:DUF2059 domain-containing protein n=1 Tax=Celeribacter sp. TaxID=1890673 RepID=UPI003A9175F8